MGKLTGFLEYKREVPSLRSKKERVMDYNPLYIQLTEEKINTQAARCMDCGVPFCHSACPLGNIIPEFNEMVYLKNWERAYQILSATNNFPEFTGLVCPAPCEDSCVLEIEGQPTTIKNLEITIVERAFELGLIKPQPPEFRTGKRVAIVGSGPAGLAAADLLNRAGHWVVVFEKGAFPGGLLRYGIPDFKLSKAIIERRIQVMKAEGIAFKTNCEAGVDIDSGYLVNDFDAIVLACGVGVPRKLAILGNPKQGVYFAMEYLVHQNQIVSSEIIEAKTPLLATGKNVIVIGGGDTGADCVGTANRQKALSITQIELLPKPSLTRSEHNPWPQWRKIVRTSSSHEEGCERLWAKNVKEYITDEAGNLTGIKMVDINWTYTPMGDPRSYTEIEGSEQILPCEMVLIAAGFEKSEKTRLIDDLHLELGKNGMLISDFQFKTNNTKVFVTGDMRTGQSLIVKAIYDGRIVAKKVDAFLAE